MGNKETKETQGRKPTGIEISPEAAKSREAVVEKSLL